jgi:hypothetical protein
MYARIEGNRVAEYPLTEHEIKQRFSNVSFTTDFPSCLPEGYVRVGPGSYPSEDKMKVVTEGVPVLNGDVWVQTWVQSNKYTAEQLEKIEAQNHTAKWLNMRIERDERISSCSWIIERHREQKDAGRQTSISDGEYSLWLEYRQNLRDFPASISDINNLNWPKSPSELNITVL